MAEPAATRRNGETQSQFLPHYTCNHRHASLRETWKTRYDTDPTPPGDLERAAKHSGIEGPGGSGFVKINQCGSSRIWKTASGVDVKDVKDHHVGE